MEESNLQRQMLFDEDDARKAMPKALAAKAKLEKINSGITYEALVEDVNYTNVLEFIEDVMSLWMLPTILRFGIAQRCLCEERYPGLWRLYGQ